MNTAGEIMSKVSKHIISAGVIPVRLEKGEYKFLLLRADDDYWDFPKGKAEDGETKMQAALREVEEETTIKPAELNFKWGKVSRETEPYGKGKVATYYIAETTRKEIELPFNPEIGKAEHYEYRWVNYEEAMELARERIQKILKWANEVVTNG